MNRRNFLYTPGVPLIASALNFASQRLKESANIVKIGDPYQDYQEDPNAFGKTYLKSRYTGDIRRLLASVAKNRVTIAQSANGTGKSHAAADVAMWGFRTYPQSQVYTLAAPPDTNLKINIWSKLGRIYNSHPELFTDCSVSIAGMNIARKRDPESFIIGQAIPVSADEATLKGKFSGKHAPFILFIVDEGDAVPEEVYKAIETCMSGGIARLLILFNPRAKSGPVYQKQNNRGGVTIKLTAFNHPNVREGKDLIPGAVSREITVQRINKWTRPLIEGEEQDSECFEVPEFLVGYVALDEEEQPYPALSPGWRKVMDPEFSYTVLADYPIRSANQLISEESINKAVTRWKLYVANYGETPPDLSPIMSVDVAELGKDSNVVFFRYGGFVSRPIVWAGLNPLATGDKCILLYKQKRAMYANVDSTGVGASVAPQMVRAGEKANRVMVGSRDFEKQLTKAELEEGDFFSVRDLMLWRLAKWLERDPGAMIPDDKELIEELLAPSYEKTKTDGAIKVEETEKIKKKIGGRSPDKLMALALGFAPIPKQPGGEVITKRYA